MICFCTTNYCLVEYMYIGIYIGVYPWRCMVGMYIGVCRGLDNDKKSMQNVQNADMQQVRLINY